MCFRSYAKQGTFYIFNNIWDLHETVNKQSLETAVIAVVLR